MKAVHTVVAGTSATGGFHKFPSGLAEKLGTLSTPGQKITFPKSVALKGAVDIYGFLTWAKGGEVQKFKELHEAIDFYIGKKDFDSCIGMCTAGSSYMKNVPTPSWIAEYILAENWEKTCVKLCCEKH